MAWSTPFPRLPVKCGKWSANFRESGLNKTLPLIEVLDELADKYAASPTQIALNWLIHAQHFGCYRAPRRHQLASDLHARRTSDRQQGKSHLSNLPHHESIIFGLSDEKPE